MPALGTEGVQLRWVTRDQMWATLQGQGFTLKARRPPWWWFALLELLLTTVVKMLVNRTSWHVWAPCTLLLISLGRMEAASVSFHCYYNFIVFTMEKLIY